MRVTDHHDLGGRLAGRIDRSERTPVFWEKRLEAMRDCLARRSCPVMRVDEMRRGIEELEPDLYDDLDFYKRKTLAIRNVLVEKGVLGADDLERRATELRCGREKDLVVAANLPDPRADGHAHDHRDDYRIDEFELISEAMIGALVDHGLLSAEALRAGVERAEMAGTAVGARIVARAWLDPSFKGRLRANGKTAMAEMGIEALETQIIVVENSPSLHNLVVCTLCSCYPRSILGSPPSWYVGKAYRARAVREPRAVLAEFGTLVADDVDVHVHDSNADMRYMVLPMRPSGTADWPEAKLIRLVTRDSLIGVTRARPPDQLDGNAE